jgi:hypothetical protein
MHHASYEVSKSHIIMEETSKKKGYDNQSKKEEKNTSAPNQIHHNLLVQACGASCYALCFFLSLAFRHLPFPFCSS